jgi:hypothetical protein
MNIEEVEPGIMVLDTINPPMHRYPRRWEDRDGYSWTQEFDGGPVMCHSPFTGTSPVKVSAISLENSPSVRETFDHLPPASPAEQPPFKVGDRVRRSGIDGGEGVVESLDQLATLRLWVSFEDGSEALWPAADCTLVPAKPSDADRWRKLIGPGLRVIGFSGLGTDQAEITLKWSANPKDEPILDDRKLLEQFFDGVKT